MRYRNPNSGDIGAASEMLVAADLVLRGFEVFRAISGNASFDLVAGNGDTLNRIEVKTNQSPFSLGVYARAKADVIATVRNSGDIEYRRLPSMKKIRGISGSWYEEKEIDSKVDLASQ